MHMAKIQITCNFLQILGAGVREPNSRAGSKLLDGRSSENTVKKSSVEAMITLYNVLHTSLLLRYCTSQWVFGVFQPLYSFTNNLRGTSFSAAKHQVLSGVHYSTQRAAGTQDCRGQGKIQLCQCRIGYRLTTQQAMTKGTSIKYGSFHSTINNGAFGFPFFRITFSISYPETWNSIPLAVRSFKQLIII